ncbi:MAG: sugar transferase [Rhodobacteraceae bacterium]|jgi:lipopolysaccharide/colanic/teichoic acid biosynthesis glycosyltransferase|nr:sugar transferase [Paracoccaceae bacterium]
MSIHLLHPAGSVGGIALQAGPSRRSVYRAVGKRALDIALVLLTAPVTLTLVLMMALLTALDGSNPFFVQRRLGKGGRVFRMWKIRTMVPDAEGMLARCLAADPALRREWESTQKLKEDERVTPFGRMLRKTSLDELPQLWNVLAGDMSLVGPRPMMPNQRDLYPGQAYFRLRPGITGPWQVSERNATTFAARAEFDAEYDLSLSFGRDVAILSATVGVVLKGTGH